MTSLVSPEQPVLCISIKGFVACNNINHERLLIFSDHNKLLGYTMGNFSVLLNGIQAYAIARVMSPKNCLLQLRERRSIGEAYLQPSWLMPEQGLARIQNKQ